MRPTFANPRLHQALHPLPARNERGGPRRGETNKNAPPLPSPLLHPMEERERSRSLMSPCGRSGWHNPFLTGRPRLVILLAADRNTRCEPPCRRSGTKR
jgi:hypothetical protein